LFFGEIGSKKNCIGKKGPNTEKSFTSKGPGLAVITDKEGKEPQLKRDGGRSLLQKLLAGQRFGAILREWNTLIIALQREA